MSQPSSIPTARRRRSRAQWQRILDAQSDSGLSQQAYCRRHKVPYSSFCHWKRELAAPAPATKPAFVELMAEAALPSCLWTFELDLGDGIVLRLRRA